MFAWWKNNQQDKKGYSNRFANSECMRMRRCEVDLFEGTVKSPYFLFSSYKYSDHFKTSIGKPENYTHLRWFIYLSFCSPNQCTLCFCARKWFRWDYLFMLLWYPTAFFLVGFLATLIRHIFSKFYSQIINSVYFAKSNLFQHRNCLWIQLLHLAGTRAYNQ